MTGFKQRLAALSGRSDLPPTLSAAIRRLSAAITKQDTPDCGLTELDRRLLSALPERLATLREGMSAKPVSLENPPPDTRGRHIAADGRARLQVFPTEKLIDIDNLREFVAAISRCSRLFKSVAVGVIIGQPLRGIKMFNDLERRIGELKVKAEGLLIKQEEADRQRERRSSQGEYQTRVAWSRFRIQLVQRIDLMDSRFQPSELRLGIISDEDEPLRIRVSVFLKETHSRTSIAFRIGSGGSFQALAGGRRVPIPPSFSLSSFDNTTVDDLLIGLASAGIDEAKRSLTQKT